MRLSLLLVLSIFLVGVAPKTTLAPIPSTLVQHPHLALVPSTEIIAEIAPKHASRGGPVPQVEKRVMRVSAYTKNDAGMNGRGLTASGERVQEGRTIATDPSIPFGADIYIPALGKTYTVTDRGGAIRGDRLDLYMECRANALKFGVQELEAYIKYP